MSEPMSSEILKLEQFGVSRIKLAAYQVLCLPENIFSSPPSSKLLEPSDAIVFGKMLKAAGVTCGTPADLGLHTAIFERRAGDKWLPVIWIRDKLAIPAVVTVIGGLVLAGIEHEIKTASAKPSAQVHMELYLDKHNGVTKLSYNGDGETLMSILKGLEQSTNSINVSGK
jgi:hypothetical protein